MSTRLTVQQILAALAVTEAAQRGHLIWPVSTPPAPSKARRR